MDDVKKEFLYSIGILCEESIMKYKYFPHRILELINDSSISNDLKLDKIKSFIRKDEPEGLINLWHLGGTEALKLSIEYLVLNEKFKTIFTDEEINVCREKLKRFALEV
ncbi:hypothetical protein [Caloramator australicus]|uniref:Uncharacterized protein n=1 Tax=Caloramator australicus RC3 TaxID=857293 RepID=I7J5J0_9CLOT|nr:hypothetical protein [Caloramator australicus]CCJ33797.1 hypothetical protein CAAU_1713 [Caloramator australicus RC3]